jgi:hypothetical protein
MTAEIRCNQHSSLSLPGWLRRPLRKGLFSFLGRIAATDDGRAVAADTLRGLLNGRPELMDFGGGSPPPPYPELGSAIGQDRTCLRSDLIFITARFRTGSTLLWNLFRNINGCTSYYEPLNERRWFDRSCRGDRIDPTHRKVEDYWTEYEGLQELGEHYRESWIEHDLLMESGFWDPHLKRYVELLAEKARGRPVLQFNRIDFRLPWFRKTFPRSKIIHLYRHPRDQWCSCFPGGNFFPPDGAVSEFAAHDHFYLLNWARDLRYHFPFLDQRSVSHPYQLFYFLWKLSYLFGKQWAHYSLGYEALTQSPQSQISDMLTALGVSGYDLGKLCALVDRPAEGKWRKYAEDAWFKQHETACETALEDFFQSAG